MMKFIRLVSLFSINCFIFIYILLVPNTMFINLIIITHILATLILVSNILESNILVSEDITH
jgi:hypothetical protein